MRLFKLLVVFLVLGAGGWWLWENQHHVSNKFAHYISGEILTLEARYTPEQIMESYRKELLGDDQHSFLDPSLKFYPYLLLDVKYNNEDNKTREGVILWSLENGEMVLNTSSWETTQGFQDCIRAGACASDYKVIRLLAKNHGTMRKEQLAKELRGTDVNVDEILKGAFEKHLIAQRGDDIFLYFENPKLPIAPQTKIAQELVTKNYDRTSRVPERYSKGEIEKAVKAAFANISLRETKELFLPVFSIQVLNPDGSVMTTYWNALNGQRILPKYLVPN